jgi:hypothetical protein
MNGVWVGETREVKAGGRKVGVEEFMWDKWEEAVLGVSWTKVGVGRWERVSWNIFDTRVSGEGSGQEWGKARWEKAECWVGECKMVPVGGRRLSVG